jgi:hypothetical protein
MEASPPRIETRSTPPRCAHCGLIITAWQLVKCTNLGGHQARRDIGVTVPCIVVGCNLPAGHHGSHQLPTKAHDELSD